jgi:hypothetical protein
MKSNDYKIHGNPIKRDVIEMAVESVIKAGQIVIDDDWLILRAYMNNLRPEGVPGVGDVFLKWVLVNRNNLARVVQVHITPTNGQNSSFHEFPTDPRLSKFDPSDRKFVAVAVAHPEHPPILNALDTDLWIHKDALETNGITVEFLCPYDIQRLLSVSS